MLFRSTLYGRLAHDPELKKVNGKDGKEISLVVADIAVNGYSSDGKADFFRVNFWGKNADKLSELCEKGNAITIDGHLAQNVYQDKEGKTRSETVIVADNFQAHEYRKSKETSADKSEDVEM